MKRAEILDKAKECVCGQREQDYGSPEDNFAKIAKLWTAYKNVSFTPGDVAMMMALLKIARIQSGTGTSDSFVDLAGYAACGGEIVTSSQENEEKDGPTVHVDRILFKTNSEAHIVLDTMKREIVKFGYASVQDFYNFVGDYGVYNPELYNYGWTSLDNVGITHSMAGYYLELPEPDAILIDKKEELK